MTPEVQLTTTCELHAEIARLGDTIAFCEGQILRKRIAIAQILDRDVQAGRETRPPTAGLAEVNAPETVAHLIDRTRANFNGDAFRVCDLVKRAAAAWPGQEQRIRVGAYAAVKRLVAAGRLERLPLRRFRNLKHEDII